jgi:hypothetical protein
MNGKVSKLKIIEVISQQASRNTVHAKPIDGHGDPEEYEIAFRTWQGTGGWAYSFITHLIEVEMDPADISFYVNYLKDELIDDIDVIAHACTIMSHHARIALVRWMLVKLERLGICPDWLDINKSYERQKDTIMNTMVTGNLNELSYIITQVDNVRANGFKLSYGDITTVLDNYKNTILHRILDRFSKYEMDFALTDIHNDIAALKRLGVTWPELNTMTKSLAAAKDESQSKLGLE